MTTVMPRPEASASPAPSQSGLNRKNRPVLVFASIGVIWLSLIAYSWTQWVADGDVGPAPKGPTPLPTWMKISLTTWQISFVLIFLVTGWFFLVKPLLRERKLTFDGVLYLTIPSLWFLLDPQQNYMRTTVNFNSHVVNVGCPQCHAPGWTNPNAQNFPEPLVGMLIYAGPIFLGIVVCTWVMQKAKARWPRLTPLGLIGIAVGLMAVADLFMELAWVLTGFYVYSGVIADGTLFDGKFYQWPLYEPLMWGPTWAAWGCIRYFKNDKGQNIVERGVDQLRVGTKSRTGVRLLASIGMVNTVMFVLFTIPNQWVALKADLYPEDIQNRSYFTNMMCGPGTDNACLDDKNPMPIGNDGVRISPDGELVVPKDSE